MKSLDTVTRTMRFLAGMVFLFSLPLAVYWALMFMYYLVTLFLGSTPLILLVLLPGLVYWKVQAGMLNIISGRTTPEGWLPRWALGILFFGLGFGVAANEYSLKSLDYRILIYLVPFLLSLLGSILSCPFQAESFHEFHERKR